MSGGSILLYIMRRDLRTSDNPILHRLSTAEHGFTHLLPVYILPPDQMEVSGLVKDGKTSPYPPRQIPSLAALEVRPSPRKIHRRVSMGLEGKS
ncbi:uncharacterized protein TrAtP1_001962 [Trichoderma atroviride]|uniref:uncharacterized protein n=1 Tax=Hypocrea atroviridis TaxID=63577 RepID=UPI003331E244|nr:hypothetical protein TrAtP1_001962 [Trichoderma atroviride]